MTRFTLPSYSLVVGFFLTIAACGTAPNFIPDGTADAGGPQVDGSTIDAPPVTGVTSSNDIVEHVRVTWTPPSVSVTSYRVLRDGLEIGRVPGTVTTFDDATAAPVSFAAPTATASVGTLRTGITVAWEPSTAAGAVASYGYTVVAVYGGREASPSESKRGSRPGDVTGYEIVRGDGTVLAVGKDVREMNDSSAPRARVTLPSPLVSVLPLRSLVSLSLPTLPVVTEPATVSYRVRAVGGQSKGALSAPAVGRRGHGLPNEVEFQWQRSGGATASAFADLPGVTGLAWFDSSAPSNEDRHFRARTASVWTEDVVSASGAARNVAWEQVVTQTSKLCGIDRDGQLSCFDQSTRYLAPSGVRYDQVALGVAPCARRKLDHKPDCWQFEAQFPPPDVAITSLVVGSAFACGLREADNHIECWRMRTGGSVPDVSTGTAYSSLSGESGSVCGVRLGDGGLDCFTASGKFTLIGAPVGPLSSVSVAAGFGDPSQGLCGLLSPSGIPSCSASVTSSLPAVPFLAVALPRSHLLYGIRSDGAVVSRFGQLTRAGETYRTVGHGYAGDPIAIDTRGRLREWPGFGATETLPDGSYTTTTAGTYPFFCGIRRADGRLDCRATAPYPLPSLEVTTTSYRDVVRGGSGVVAIEEPSRALRYLGEPAGAPVLPAGAFDALVEGCGLRSNTHTVACWGSVAAPPETSAFDAIATYDGSGCGIRAIDKRVECWGPAFNGWFSWGATPADAMESISLSLFRACAVRASDHRAVCWGDGGLVEPFSAPLKSVTAGNPAWAIRLADHAVLHEDLAAPIFEERFSSLAPPCGIRENDGKRVCSNGHVPVR